MIRDARGDRRRALVARLSGYTDAALVDALTAPEHAGLAAELLRERLVDQPDRFHDDVLQAIAGAHDLSRRLEGGLTGPLPLTALRSFARAEIGRRGGEAWRPLCPRHSGVRCLAALEGHDGEVRRLQALEGGVLASAAADGSRLIWELGSGRQLASLRREDGVGPEALLRWRAGAVVALRPGGPRVEARLELPEGSIRAVAGTRLALLEGGPSDATVSVREIPGGRVLWSRAGYAWDFRVGDTLDVDLSPGGRYLAVGQGYGAHVEIVELDSGRSVAFDSETPSACLLALGPEPLALLSQRGRLVVHDLDAGSAAHELEGAGPAALDGAAAVLLRAVENRIELHEVRGRRLWQYEAPGQVDQVAVSADGELCCALVRGAWGDDERSYRPVLRVLSRSGNEVAAIDGAYAVAAVPGRNELVTGGRWGTIWRWEIAPAATAAGPATGGAAPPRRPARRPTR